MKTILYIHGMGGGADSRIPSVLNGWFRKHRRDIRVVVRTYDFHPDRAAEQIRAWYEELQPALVIGESLGANHALALYGRRSPGCGATALRGSRESDPSGGMLPRSAASPQPANALPPLLLVSPALNAPKFLYALRLATRIPAVHRWINRIYKPREGRRQALDFAPDTLAAWGAYRNVADFAIANGRPQEPGHPGPEGAFPEGSKSPHLQGQGAPALKEEQSKPYAFFGRRDHYRRYGVVSVKKWRRTFGPGTFEIYDGTHFMEETYLRRRLIPAILERI
jgi:pimeloyl-ACP methyl ester carboxylesterase